MKQLIFSFITMLIIITSVIVNSFIIKSNAERIADLLDDIPNSIEYTDDYENAAKEYFNIQNYIGLTVSHEDLTNIEDSFLELMGAIEAEDTESLIITKSRLIGALRHLGRLSGINSDSIF